LALGSQSNFNQPLVNKVSLSFPPPTVGLLSAVTSCGLHTSTTALNAGEAESGCDTSMFFLWVF